MKEVFVLSLIVASISYTVTRAFIFAPVRDWVKCRSAWLGELVSCGYCFGHWVSFAIVGVYGARSVIGVPGVDYFLTAVMIAWLSAWQQVLFTVLLNIRSEGLARRAERNRLNSNDGESIK